MGRVLAVTVVDHAPIGRRSRPASAPAVRRPLGYGDVIRGLARRLTDLRRRYRVVLDRASDVEADRQTLAAENGALRDERDLLREENDALTEQLTRSRGELDRTRAAVRAMARRATDRRRQLRATGRVLSEFEDECDATWDAMPAEVRRAAMVDDAGLPAAVETLVAIVERVLPGWFSTPAEARARNEQTAHAERWLRTLADEPGGAPFRLVLDELDLYRRLRTRGGPAPAETPDWVNPESSSPSSATRPQHEVTA